MAMLPRELAAAATAAASAAPGPGPGGAKGEEEEGPSSLLIRLSRHILSLRFVETVPPVSFCF